MILIFDQTLLIADSKKNRTFKGLFQLSLNISE